jgi:hypothetical protein
MKFVIIPHSTPPTTSPKRPALELLAREVEAGRMTVRKCTIGGKARNVYRDV